MTKTMTYKVEDIFQDIPEDNKNVLMTIPPEVSEQMGWKPGDKLKVNIDKEGVITLSKVEPKEEDE